MTQHEDLLARLSMALLGEPRSEETLNTLITLAAVFAERLHVTPDRAVAMLRAAMTCQPVVRA